MKRITTIKEYDEQGNLIKETIIEEEDTPNSNIYSQPWIMPSVTWKPGGAPSSTSAPQVDLGTYTDSVVNWIRKITK